MNFDFSDEQKQFREQLRRFLDKASPPAEARRVLDGAAPYSEGVWQGLAELGVQGALIPEEFGGLGLDPLVMCVAAEEIGRALAPVPALSSIYLCTEAIRLFGSPAQHERWLPALAAGSVIGTWAVAEGTAQSPHALKTTWRSGRLVGCKSPVLDGGIAHIAIVLAKDSDGRAVLALCELGQSAVRRRALSTVDPSRPCSELILENAPGELLPQAGENAWELLQNRAAILLAFEQVGAADRALYLARDYALQRKAFGRVIGSYQAIKHKLVSVYAKNEIARGHAYYGAWALRSNASELPLAAAGARVAGIEASSFAAQENLHVHGGIGFTWESDCQLFYRRTRLYALILGSSATWKERVAACLTEGDRHGLQ